MAWNPIDSNLIVAGLDKYRSDYSVLLWDIMKSPTVQDVNGAGKLNTIGSGLEFSRPIAEFGISEVSHSLAWFNSSSKHLAIGMNLKTIKIIDFRGSFNKSSSNNQIYIINNFRFQQSSWINTDESCSWFKYRSPQR